MFVIFYLLFVYYQYPIYFCSVFIQVDMSILYLVSISCVAMCGIEAHLWPIVKDLCNKKVVQFWARCYVLAGFGQDRLQPVCGWHAQSLARLSGGHRVQTMTNPDPNQADQMGPSDWLWREAGQHFSRGNNKYTATAMWLLCNFFFVLYTVCTIHMSWQAWPHTSHQCLKYECSHHWESQLPSPITVFIYRVSVDNCLSKCVIDVHVLYLSILPECAMDSFINRAIGGQAGSYAARALFSTEFTGPTEGKRVEMKLGLKWGQLPAETKDI